MTVDKPTLLAAAAPAVQTGIQGIKSIFGFGGGQQQAGGIPTEEDSMRQQQGARRFAQHEGAATTHEVQAIDHSFGLENVDTDEGMKNVIRVDKVVQYYLEHGDKKRAEAAAASLLMRGAAQVQQSAAMAGAAFENWQQTGDPNALRHASMAMEKANQLIPNGMDLKIDVDPHTRQIIATTIGPDGKQQQQVVDPQMVPALLGKAMDGSAYWKAVYQIGQPRMAEQDISQQGQNARQAQTQQYEGYKNEREAQEEQFRHERDLSDGKSPGERRDKASQQYFQDWSQRYGAAGDDKNAQSQLFQEALGYTYQNTPDRKTAMVADDFQMPAESPYKINQDDMPAVRQMAEIIARKNAVLDPGGAMEMAAALVTSPQVTNTADGRLNVSGFDLVFSPDLLPRVGELRKKYVRQP